MVALNSKFSAEQGRASLRIAHVAGNSAVTSAFATSPLRLLTPRSRGPCVWAFTSSFGGGLVAGDQTHLHLDLGPGTRCFLGTQASTKIYRNPRRLPCAHTTTAALAGGSLLAFAPDPVQLFAGSRYEQRQEFHVADDAGLILLDWFSAGRVARGERWAFSRYLSRNDVFVGNARVFADALLLESFPDEPMDSPHRTGRFNCFALLLAIGPQLRPMAATILAEISSRPIERDAPLLCSASPIRDGMLLRVAAETVEQAGREIHHHLHHFAGLTGDDPWSRKW